jgi:hypothetical protein
MKVATLDLIIVWRGYRRLFWYQVCPACNSDAPHIDHCDACQKHRESWPWCESKKISIWRSFLIEVACDRISRFKL